MCYQSRESNGRVCAPSPGPFQSAVKATKFANRRTEHLKRETQPDLSALAIFRVVESTMTHSGARLADLSIASPILLVFLRHAGCTFCRETLLDISESRSILEQARTRIILVHMGDSQALNLLLVKYGLGHLDLICDPDQQLYKAFGLKRGTFAQLFGLKVFARGVLGGAVLRHGLGAAVNDAAQMPGVFLIENNTLIRRFRHRSAADRPDYVALCNPNP